MDRTPLRFPRTPVLVDDGAVRDLTLPTGAVTLLMTDLEGSTKLWEADEALAAIVLARHHALLDAAITLHGGVRPEEQGEGDSIVAAFVRATDAVAAALDIQIAFAAGVLARRGGTPGPHRGAHRRGEPARPAELPRPDDHPLRARCAVLRTAARAVLSGTTKALVLEGLPDNAALRDLGEHRLKDLGRAERVWQICHPDVENEFPPLRTLDMPSEQPAGAAHEPRRPRRRGAGTAPSS